MNSNAVYEQRFSSARIADSDVIRKLIAEAAAASSGQKHAVGFLLSEWEDIVDAWRVDDWEAYRDVERLGPG
jgi:hypothetical protein